MNVLMVVAHPDDEVLFGWPVLCSSDNSVSLLVLTDNHVKYGQGPTDAVFEVAAANDVKWSHVLRFDTNVYRLPTRSATPTLRQVTDAMRGEIAAAVSLWRPDVIFTHNPMGEYGHGDHRLAFNLVASFNLPILTTDVCFSNGCHVSSNTMPNIFRRFYASGQRVGEYVLNEQWYERMKSTYERRRAWSWSGHEPVRKCGLFLFY